jgi:uncharacterized protein YbjT (DUF2867 family)
LNEKILIVGATGVLGQPVTRRLKEKGYNITILSSNSANARSIFGNEFEIIDGDVTQPESLKQPLESKDFLYINLSASLDPVKYQKVEIEGTANLARAALEAGIKKIMNISSAASKGKEIGRIFLDAKVRAENALIESGVPYTVMRPSWFFETLPHFIQDGRAAILGRQPMKIHWLAASDYAEQVANAFKNESSANKCLYNLGPEKLTMVEALQRYCDKFHPGVKAKEISFWLTKLLALLTGNKKLNLAIPFFEYFSEQDEDVDGSVADSLLGPNRTTINQWLESQKQ